jgi:hypothetical protein
VVGHARGSLRLSLRPHLQETVSVCVDQVVLIYGRGPCWERRLSFGWLDWLVLGPQTVSAMGAYRAPTANTGNTEGPRTSQPAHQHATMTQPTTDRDPSSRTRATQGPTRGKFPRGRQQRCQWIVCWPARCLTSSVEG